MSRWRAEAISFTGRFALAGAVSALLVAVGLASAGAARAGTYTITQCNYFGGGQLPMLQWAPSGSPFASYVDSCPQGSYGVYYFVPAGARMSPNQLSGASLYSPDPGITLERVRLHYLSFRVSRGSRAFLELAALGPAGTQTLQSTETGSATSGTAADLGLPSGTTGFGIYIYCSTSASTSCRWETPNDVFWLTGIQEVLREDVPPALSLTGGTLLTGGVRRGDQTLTYAASDGQSGVAGVSASIAGHVVASADFSRDPTRCAFVSWAACPRQQQGALLLHTNQLDDGTYGVLLGARDAAGNTASVERESITISNAPQFEGAPRVLGAPQVDHAPASALDGRASGLSKDGSPPVLGRTWALCDADGVACQTLAGSAGTEYQPTPAEVGRRLRVIDVAVNDHGTATSTSDPGPPILDAHGSPEYNGRNGGPGARLLLRARPPATVAFARSDQVLHGRLRAPTGAPVAGATLELIQRPDLPGTSWAPVASAISGPGGSFSVRAPRGPSRTLRLTYRYSASETNPTAHLDLRQHVSAGVSLGATRHLRNGQSIRFRGRVLGGFIPPTGKLVELQVNVGGVWQDLEAARSDPQGRFSASRRITQTTGPAAYRFRVVVRRESDYPFLYGRSSVRVVRVN